MYALSLQQTLDQIERQLYDATADAVLGRHLHIHRSDIILAATYLFNALQENRVRGEEDDTVIKRLLETYLMVLEIIDRAITDKLVS